MSQRNQHQRTKDIKIENLDSDSDENIDNSNHINNNKSKNKNDYVEKANTVNLNVINESKQNTGIRKHSSRLDKNSIRQHSPKLKSKQSFNRKHSPEMDLYEVYFNNNCDNTIDGSIQGKSTHLVKAKSNIQKIKFKRRSPSIESL